MPNGSLNNLGLDFKDMLVMICAILVVLVAELLNERMDISVRAEKRKTFIQFIKFGLVGFSNTAISYSLNVLILFLLRNMQWKQDYIAANIISFTISMFWTFYWNNKYVFQEKQEGKRDKWKSMGKSFWCTDLQMGFS